MELHKNEKRYKQKNVNNLSDGKNEIYWRKYWDSRSREVKSDNELDRINADKDTLIQKYTEKDLYKLLRPDISDKVLDVGCGTGIDICRLNNKVKKIIGIDHSINTIKRCALRCQKNHLDNLNLIVGSITKIGLRANTFDKVLCMSVLHYLNDYECEQAIKEMIRVCKKDGLIVFHVKNLSSIYAFILFFVKKIKLLLFNKPIMENYRSFKWYTKKLSKNGAILIDYNSTNKFCNEIFPSRIKKYIKILEEKYYYSDLLKKYGTDLKFVVLVKKQK